MRSSAECARGLRGAAPVLGAHGGQVLVEGAVREWHHDGREDRDGGKAERGERAGRRAARRGEVLDEDELRAPPRGLVDRRLAQHAHRLGPPCLLADEEGVRERRGAAELVGPGGEKVRPATAEQAEGPGRPREPRAEQVQVVDVPGAGCGQLVTARRRHDRGGGEPRELGLLEGGEEAVAQRSMPGRHDGVPPRRLEVAQAGERSGAEPGGAGVRLRRRTPPRHPRSPPAPRPLVAHRGTRRRAEGTVARIGSLPAPPVGSGDMQNEYPPLLKMTRRDGNCGQALRPGAGRRRACPRARARAPGPRGPSNHPLQVRLTRRVRAEAGSARTRSGTCLRTHTRC